MTRSAVGTASKHASRIVARTRGLWLGRNLPPGEATVCAVQQALPEGVLTARELIAMARAARVDRP